MLAAEPPPAPTPLASPIESEEIRVAIAWNGGVSLAVWMGGVAVELDCAHRSYFGEENGGDDETPAQRRVYATLSRALGRRLLPDILTGASAGGLNGALLAGTIQAGRRLPPDLLRKKWLQFGDFSKLLQPTEKRNPQSVMRGDLFLDDLKLMFAAILGDADPPAAPHADPTNYAQDVEQTSPPDAQVKSGLEPYPVMLDVMITNVLGEPQGFVDAWNNEFVAREYRAPARFRKRADFSATALATAARASSSFPAAFEPVKITGDVALRADLQAGDVRWAVDGGLLENAPVKYAIDLIPISRTRKSVRRFLCYLDAAPARRAPVAPDPAQPDLKDVIGYVVNLPRDARVVDQLYAVEQATRQGMFAGDVQAGLLGLGTSPCLTETAEALFDAYHRRRSLLALEELLKSTAEARRVFDRFQYEIDLPWLPRTFGVPDVAANEWPWGFRAAQRVLNLQLDLSRRRLENGEQREAELKEAEEKGPKDRDTVERRAEERKAILAEREAILAAWPLIDEQLAALEDLRTCFLGNDRIYQKALKITAEAVAASDLLKLPDPYQPAVAAAVLAATKAYLAVPGQEHETVSGFLERALAIEVITRSISADEEFDTAERIEFVQLTPVCPSPIFTARPLRESGPDSPEKKLTGIRLGHFAGFYRSSWRANDFMWGRLDAAVRIVDLLLAHVGDRLAKVDIDDVCSALAELLVPDGDDSDAQDRRWLAHEALIDAKTPTPLDRRLAPFVQDAVAGYPPGGEVPPRDRMLEFMHAALKADLAKSERALFTRTVCTRAAQLEIVRQELDPLAQQTEEDARLGAYTAPLDFGIPRNGSVERAVDRLRACWDKPETYLPRRLGRDDGDESVSNLALETITHAMFVALSMARGANVALGRLLGVLRIPLLSIAGVASRSLLSRAAVLASFVSAATYLASRLVKTDRVQVTHFDALWSGWVLLSWVAAIGILAVVLVPSIRAFRSGTIWRKAGQSAWAFGLALPLVVAVVFALAWGHLGTIQLLTTPGGAEPPQPLVWLTLGLIVGGAPALRTARLPIAGSVQDQVLGRVGALPIALLVGAASLTVLGWSIAALVDVLTRSNWQIATAALAFASFPLCLAYLVLGTQHVRNRSLLRSP